MEKNEENLNENPFQDFVVKEEPMQDEKFKIENKPQNYYKYLDSLKHSTLFAENIDLQEEVVIDVKENNQDNYIVNKDVNETNFLDNDSLDTDS